MSYFSMHTNCDTLMRKIYVCLVCWVFYYAFFRNTSFAANYVGPSVFTQATQTTNLRVMRWMWDEYRWCNLNHTPDNNSTEPFEFLREKKTRNSSTRVFTEYSVSSWFIFGWGRKVNMTDSWTGNTRIQTSTDWFVTHKKTVLRGCRCNTPKQIFKLLW